MEMASLRQLIDAGDANRAVLGAPDREDLSLRELLARLDGVARTLGAAGVRRGHCVAIAAPNGPEAAVAFLAVTAGLDCVAAPLNPASRQAELEFTLRDTGASVFLVEASLASPESAFLGAADAVGVPVFVLLPEPGGPAGAFTLERRDGRPVRGERVGDGPDPVALFLHTSGTTSRPKLVPLTQKNLSVSTVNVVKSLGLTPGDTCLNVMPLFHIHGLVASLLASLASGGRAFCAPGFQAHRFFRWLEASAATWYTAVPSIHQAVVARGGRNREVAERTPLRFIRSCSAALPGTVQDGLESVFSVPVISAYGMTEASHQISTTFPGVSARRGSVGWAGATEVAVLDGEGRPVPAGTPGEVGIRGAAVTAGYHANPEANRDAFVEGFLRTGDEGVLDAGGELTLLGRLKEIINAGGEKVSPFEVEEALLAHPHIAAAVAFALPSRTLGEAPAAAVVLGEGTETTPEEIRRFVAARLSGFKVPRKVVVVAEIPKGPTGKPQRIGLAARLGLTGDD